MSENAQNDPGQTAGDFMSTGWSKSVKSITIFVSILIYLAGIVYAEVHGLNMLTKGVNPDFIMWAYIGMLALGLSAIALPLALHFWTFASMQRIFTFGFYALDLALLILNAFLDYGVNTGEQTTSWGGLYLTYIMPATPVICAIGWSVIWLLDPSTKSHVLRQTLRTAILEAKANQVASAAGTTQVSEQVKHAAQGEVEAALTELFGRPVTTMRMKEQTVVSAPKLTEQPARNPYALPCGHTEGVVMNSNADGYACRVCSKPVTIDELKQMQEARQKPDAPFQG